MLLGDKPFVCLIPIIVPNIIHVIKANMSFGVKTNFPFHSINSQMTPEIKPEVKNANPVIKVVVFSSFKTVKGGNL